MECHARRGSIVCLLKGQSWYVTHDFVRPCVCSKVYDSMQRQMSSVFVFNTKAIHATPGFVRLCELSKEYAGMTPLDVVRRSPTVCAI